LTLPLFELFGYRRRNDLRQERREAMGQARDVVVGKFAALNAQDQDKMVGYFSPQAQKQIPAGTLSGSDQIAAFVSAVWEAFPDIELALTEVVEQGSKVSVRGAMVGTHAGTLHTPSGDIPATGQRIDLAFSDSYEVVDGLIVASHLYFDRLSLLEQLGVMGAPAAA
jgi:predicted ester cyclase